MKTTFLAISTAITTIALSNCAGPVGPNTRQGAATGALGGAVVGGIIGNQSGRALEGAAIGAAGGAAVGGAIGNNRDQQNYNRY